MFKAGRAWPLFAASAIFMISLEGVVSSWLESCLWARDGPSRRAYLLACWAATGQETLFEQYSIINHWSSFASYRVSDVNMQDFAQTAQMVCKNTSRWMLFPSGLRETPKMKCCQQR